MAKAIFESNDAPTSGKPISTPVRSFDRVKDLGDSAFNVTGQDGGTKRLVTNSNNKYTVYKRLGSDEGYPRGYNPEQMGQVHSAEYADNPLLDIESDARPGQEGRLHPEHERNLLRQNIARSKVDPTQLKRRVSVKAIGSFPDQKNFNTWGEYFDRRGSGDIEIRSDKISGPTLIHEIGHHDEKTNLEAAEGMKRAVAPVKEEIADFLSDKRIRTLYDGTEVMDAFPGEHKKLAALHNKRRDIIHGYKEGYANKYAEDNYVQDPRDAKRGVQDPADAYVTAAFVGPHTRKNSRMSAFSTGYHAAGGPAIDVDHPDIQRKLERLKLAHTPKWIKYWTHRDYTYTGADLLKATAAAREAKDAEIRAKNV